jgi:hypothetical protein
MVRSASVLAIVLLTAGCGGQREFAEVEGTVTFDGKPIPQVQVVFVPDATKGNKGNNATGVTDAQGHYRLRAERDGKDGTVLGVHRVFFVDLTTVPNLLGLPPEPGKAPLPSGPGTPPRFPKVYGEALDTPYQDIEVKPGKQTLDFDLKSKGK